jgi:hypothetical protein
VERRPGQTSHILTFAKEVTDKSDPSRTINKVTNQKKGKAMKHIFTGFNLIGAIALLALAVGCANTQPTENLLSAAGFRTIIANTPQRQQHLKTLPPNKVTLVQRNGKNYYVYADPAHNQIYVGNPSQYQSISSSVWPITWSRINLQPPK